MISLKRFGRSGYNSSRTIFGAAAFSSVTQNEANRTLDLLLKYGVNHIDTAASYGESELRIGRWMKEFRNQFFLATKTGKRTYKDAKEELYRSLERLNVDKIDLWQMHFLVNQQEWDIAMHAGGAIDAFLEAKEEGLVSYIGVTGHGLTAPVMHIRSLELYDFDSVLLPYNYILMQNIDYSTEFNKLVKKCTERNIAIQTIKSICKAPLGDKQSKHAVWYDPLVQDKAIEHAVAWVLGNPDVFLNTVGDIHLLEKVLLTAEKKVLPPGDEIMQSDIDKYKIRPLFIE